MKDRGTILKICPAPPCDRRHQRIAPNPKPPKTANKAAAINATSIFYSDFSSLRRPTDHSNGHLSSFFTKLFHYKMGMF
jgi:hypothetical protein